jgi:hypothetical protein
MRQYKIRYYNAKSLPHPPLCLAHAPRVYLINELVNITEQLLGLGFGVLNYALAFGLGRRWTIGRVAARHEAFSKVSEYGAIFFELVAEPRARFAASFGRIKQADSGPGKGTTCEAKQAGCGFASHG